MGFILVESTSLILKREVQSPIRYASKMQRTVLLLVNVKSGGINEVYNKTKSEKPLDV